MGLYDNNPCKECKKRTDICHGNCNDHKIWKEIVDEKKKKIRKETDREKMIDDVIITSHRRGKKRRHFK